MLYAAEIYSVVMVVFFWTTFLMRQQKVARGVFMLPPHLKAIFDHVEQIVERSSRRVDDRSQCEREQQNVIACALQALADDFRGYKAKQEAGEREKNRRENYTLGALCITVLISLLLAGLSGCQLREMRKTLIPVQQQAKAAQDQLALAYPPRILVPVVQAHVPGNRQSPPNFKRGEKIQLVVRAINHGREVAIIESELDEAAMPFWHKGPLPMMRPFETQPTAVLHHVKKWEKKPAMMQPGEEVEWCFQTEVPSDYGPRMSLYVIGFVRYKDRLNFHQYVLFARRYDPLEGRFLPVKDNAPYENEN